MAPKKKPAGGQAGDRFQGVHTKHSTSAQVQREKLLAALKRGPVDAVHAYRVLDILHAPRRVFELRKQGYPIITGRAQRYTETGIAHRVGVYELQKPEQRPRRKA